MNSPQQLLKASRYCCEASVAQGVDAFTSLGDRTAPVDDRSGPDVVEAPNRTRQRLVSGLPAVRAADSSAQDPRRRSRRSTPRLPYSAPLNYSRHLLPSVPLNILAPLGTFGALQHTSAARHVRCPLDMLSARSTQHRYDLALRRSTRSALRGYQEPALTESVVPLVHIAPAMRMRAEKSGFPAAACARPLMRNRSRACSSDRSVSISPCRYASSSE